MSIFNLTVLVFLLMTVLNGTAIALPITSKPLDNNPDHLVWEVQIGSDTRYSDEYGKARKITPKSIFIAPTLDINQQFNNCPIGYRVDHRGECVQTIQINASALLSNRINAIFTFNNQNNPSTSDIDYDYDNEEVVEEVKGPDKFIFPLFLDTNEPKSPQAHQQLFGQVSSTTPTLVVPTTSTTPRPTESTTQTPKIYTLWTSPPSAYLTSTKIVVNDPVQQVNDLVLPLGSSTPRPTSTTPTMGSLNRLGTTTKGKNEQLSTATMNPAVSSSTIDNSHGLEDNDHRSPDNIDEQLATDPTEEDTITTLAPTTIDEEEQQQENVTSIFDSTTSSVDGNQEMLIIIDDSAADQMIALEERQTETSAVPPTEDQHAAAFGTELENEQFVTVTTIEADDTTSSILDLESDTTRNPEEVVTVTQVTSTPETTTSTPIAETTRFWDNIFRSPSEKKFIYVQRATTTEKPVQIITPIPNPFPFNVSKSTYKRPAFQFKVPSIQPFVPPPKELLQPPSESDEDKLKRDRLNESEQKDAAFENIDVNNRFVYHHLNIMTTTEKIEVTTIMPPEIETTTTPTPEVVPRKFEYSSTKVFENNKPPSLFAASKVRFPQESVQFDANSPARSKIRFPGPASNRQGVPSSNKLVPDSRQTQVVGSGKDKDKKPFWWFPPGWEVDTKQKSKPMLLRFWSKMPLIKDSTLTSYRSPSYSRNHRENSKSPSENFYKEVSAQDIYKVLQSRQLNKQQPPGESGRR